MRTSLKILIAFTAASTLFVSFFPVLNAYLALSPVAIVHSYYYQFISYIFVESGRISLSFLITLLFNLYLLYIFGSSLIERMGQKLFFTLYFSSSVLAGLSTLFFKSFFLTGATNPVFAVMTAWMMMNPKSTLLLFFTIPVKSYLLVTILIGATLLLNLGAGQFDQAVSLFTACLYAYIFSIFVFQQFSPFAFLKKFERKIASFFHKEKKPKAQVYDFKTGQPVPKDDDAFMDEMLDRISRHGEGSLTEEERKRMQEISKKKRP